MLSRKSIALKKNAQLIENQAAYVVGVLHHFSPIFNL